MPNCAQKGHLQSSLASPLAGTTKQQRARQSRVIVLGSSSKGRESLENNILAELLLESIKALFFPLSFLAFLWQPSKGAQTTQELVKKGGGGKRGEGWGKRNRWAGIELRDSLLQGIPYLTLPEPEKKREAKKRESLLRLGKTSVIGMRSFRKLKKK